MESTTEGGEKAGVREAMEGFKKHLVEQGNDPRFAEKKARELARDWDRRNSK